LEITVTIVTYSENVTVLHGSGKRSERIGLTNTYQFHTIPTKIEAMDAVYIHISL
jgi:hypothetical protein